MSQKELLRDIKKILKTRANVPQVQDRVYSFYVMLLVALVVIPSVVRLVFVGFNEMSFGAVGTFASSNLLLIYFFFIVTVVVFLTGRIYGPALSSVPYLETVVTSPIPRHLTLLKSFRTNGSILTLVLVSVALLFCWVFSPESFISLGLLLFLGGVVAYGTLLNSLWLFSQQVKSGSKIFITILLALVGGQLLLVVVSPSNAGLYSWVIPWGWVSILWGNLNNLSGSGIAAFMLLFVSGLICFFFRKKLLDSQHFEQLLEQSRRLNAIIGLAITGDIKSAGLRLKHRPQWGRKWNWAPPKSAVLAIVQSDFMRAARYPFRSFIAVCLITLSASVISFSISSPQLTLLSFAGILILYFSLGIFVEGLRLFVLTLGSPITYGLPTFRHLVAHLIFPFTIGIFESFVTGSVVVAHAGLSTSIVFWLVLLAILCLVLQAFSALKGELPISLFAPVPTPMGDMAAVNVILWLGDAVILLLIFGGGLTILFAQTDDSFWQSFVLVGSIILLTFWSKIRFERLSRS